MQYACQAYQLPRCSVSNYLTLRNIPLFSGTPSEIFYFGMQWFVVVLTFPVASILISVFILPVFYRLELTSVYEVWTLTLLTGFCTGSGIYRRRYWRWVERLLQIDIISLVTVKFTHEWAYPSTCLSATTSLAALIWLGVVKATLEWKTARCKLIN